MSIVTIADVIERPQDFNQCRNCLNPVGLKNHSCKSCGCTTFVDDGEKSFSHLESELGDDLEQEITV